jgi:hypothetical protein
MDPRDDPRSWHKGQGWEDQLRRAQRWHRRATAAIGNARAGGMSDDDWDDIYAFFMNAYHVGDWMIADGACTRTDWYNLVKDHFELSLCRDLCNGVKHRRLTGKPAVDASPWTLREYVPPGERWHLLVGEPRRFHLLEDVVDGVIARLEAMCPPSMGSRENPGRRS